LDDGSPFFYLADTAWRLFKALDGEEVSRYLDDRASKGFTVIQAYVLRGLAVPNWEGEVPLRGYDPTRINEAFFVNIDRIVTAANERGLVLGLVTTFGEHVGAGPVLAAHGRVTTETIFDENNAYKFGQLLADRYREACVIWILGGDRNPLAHLPVWIQMGRGLKDASPEALVSYHGPGGSSSSLWFHGESWLDFNTIQSGHARDVANYLFVSHDRMLVPPKPTLDMEPRYENHPDLGSSDSVVIDAAQVRAAAYWAVLAGAAGHGYGANDIWQFARLDERGRRAFEDYSNRARDRLPPTVDWENALDFEGAWGMMWLRELSERYKWYDFVPMSISPDAIGKRSYLAAAQNAEAGIGLVYSFARGCFPVDLAPFNMKSAELKWYDPRTGEESDAGRISGPGEHVVRTPSKEIEEDWVLVLKRVD
jgi:hypothetical protein